MVTSIMVDPIMVTSARVIMVTSTVMTSIMVSPIEVGMRLFFICAHVVAVYADLYAHIRMKPHRKIHIVYADMRIYGYVNHVDVDHIDVDSGHLHHGDVDHGASSKI